MTQLLLVFYKYNSYNTELNMKNNGQHENVLLKIIFFCWLSGSDDDANKLR